MEISIDTANAAMGLGGGLLALVAAVVGLITVLLPKDDPHTALKRVAGRMLGAAPHLAVVVGLLLNAAGYPRTGLALLGCGLLAQSVMFAVSRTAMTRIEVLSLVSNWATASVAFSFYFLSRFADLLERTMGILEKTVR